MINCGKTAGTSIKVRICKERNYSNETTPPRSVKVFFNFSASSFGKFSFSTLGRDSTNFFA
jgi:hypothetical protein